jgi:hypothetical protein
MLSPYSIYRNIHLYIEIALSLSLAPVSYRDMQKSYFATACSISLLGALMVYANSVAARALLLIPLLLIQHFSFLFFSKRYDSAMMAQWKKKEAKLMHMAAPAQPKEGIAAEKTERYAFAGNARGRTERISELY